jgi:hypothetical protein
MHVTSALQSKEPSALGEPADSGIRLIRVFPRRTKATPTDDLVYCGEPDLFAEADAVHISVSFSWDLPAAERLAKVWKHVAPVSVGGPATGTPSGEFVPGRYLKRGYVITSRGCPNHCWFCSVPQREGTIRELGSICHGWNVLDDNLLACSETHIRKVFDMLGRQPRRPEFTGGLEAKRFTPWIAKCLFQLKPKQMFFAYDTADDFSSLEHAAQMLFTAGFTRNKHAGGYRVGTGLRCYVLCGWPRDTLMAAEQRMHDVLALGFVPMAMLWRDQQGRRDQGWTHFQRQWARPALICHHEAVPSSRNASCAVSEGQSSVTYPWDDSTGGGQRPAFLTQHSDG